MRPDANVHSLSVLLHALLYPLLFLLFAYLSAELFHIWYIG